MPVLASSAFNIAGDVTSRMRAILNDSEVTGGDVLQDTAPFTFEFVNLGFERVQIELATVGVETYSAEAWLIGLPTLPTLDPEARMIVDDTGTRIVYPNGTGNTTSLTPQLPTDLIVPLRLWERQNGTTNFIGDPMKERNGGLMDMTPGSYFIDWEWKSDGLYFRGATQSQDVKILYEKHLPKLVLASDPVPIRGVVNAAAYQAAKAFTESRGGAIAPAHKATAEEELNLLKMISARRRQRRRVRRQPYSGGRGRGRGYSAY